MARRFAPILLAATGLFLSVGPLAAAAGLNRTAVQSLASCSSSFGGLLFGEADTRNAILFAGAARCGGDTAALWAGYRLAFLGPVERIGLVRAAVGEDELLAKELIAARPDFAGGYFWLAEIRQSNGEIQLAIEAYRTGLALDPTSGDDWYALGRLYAELGETDNALLAYDQACMFGDRGKNGCPNAAGLYFERGEYETALTRFQRTVRQLPGWVPGIRGLADTLIALGREREAVPYLEELAAMGDAAAIQQLEAIGGEE